MNHYTYELRFENGMKYIGVRSCKCPIDEDSYVGSSKLIPSTLYATCEKVILGVFDTRIDAQQDEITRHAKLDVARNPEYYNGINAKSTGFSPVGLTAKVSENVANRAKRFRAYRGENRTEAQKLADQALSKFKGTKNPAKGLSGLDNTQVKPWYYVTPEGEYVEVYTSIRQYIKSHPIFKAWPVSRIYERMSIAPHIPGLKGAIKGFTFGYIHDKPHYLTQENIAIMLQVLQHINIPNLQNLHKINAKHKPNLISNIIRRTNESS